MATASVAVRAELVDHDHGHLCLDCRLATGVRAVVMTQTGGRPAELHEVLLCPECEGRNVVVDSEPRPCSWSE